MTTLIVTWLFITFIFVLLTLGNKNFGNHSWGKSIFFAVLQTIAITVGISVAKMVTFAS